MAEFFDWLDGFVWSPFLLIPLLLGTGLWLTFRLGFLQFRKLGAGLRLGLIDRKDDGGEGDISQYQALSTALAATVGVGNIVGVSTAIGIGGPGALFWMWVTGILGMASKYSEAFLGVRFRTKDAKGEISGGPQYYLQKAIPNKFGKTLAVIFAVFAALAAFGIGNLTQANAVADNMEHTFGVPHIVSGIIMFVGVGAVLLGGIKSIGRMTAAFVPFMIIIFLFASIWVLIAYIDQVPGAFALVFTDAFSGTAATGGFLGAGIILVIQMGVARGLFSNESGMGSAAIAAAAAKTTHPVRQGLVSMTQTFIDTIIMVSLTGLAIIATGVWQDADGNEGALTSMAYTAGMPGEWGGTIVAVSLVFFAFSTIIGWSYYGERSFESLVGRGGTIPYRMAFCIVVVIGATTELTTVWAIASAMNGLMALPNLIGLVVLSGLIARETKAYLSFDPQLRATAAQVEEWQRTQILVGDDMSKAPKK